MKPRTKIKKPARRGFAAMDEATQRRICAMGGAATVAKKGRKHMAKIGAIGGKISGRRYRAQMKAALASAK